MAVEQTIDDLLAGYDYELVNVTHIGRLYTKLSQPAVFVDDRLFNLSAQEYQYVDYTSYQNRIMHAAGGLYRFLWQNTSTLIDDLAIFLDDYQENFELKRFGADRSETHIDSTPPEHNFAMLFEQVFGPRYLHALQPESEYVDKVGHVRYIDYVLVRNNGRIAIELNGESYHHPLITGRKRYRSQLFKQNSLVHDNYLVYRWSNRGMQDQSKFSDQLREYFGDKNKFIAAPRYRAQRAVSFNLYQHQQEAVTRISEERAGGKNTFLVVLPTGTGKTEVFIEDLVCQINSGCVNKALAIVPSIALKDQLLARLAIRVKNLIIGTDENDNNLNIVVQTNAYMHRHFHKVPAKCFDYIMVDEAHHAAAQGMRKVLEYFRPKTLLGLTATDQRLDQKKLETLFGSYRVDLTLEQAIEKGLVPTIRAFRLQSNIDLSQVRFNGKDFVKSDLNKIVQIPSRDQLIVDLLNQYFSQPLIHDSELLKVTEHKKISAPKQGVIFCVDIKHAKRMANLLNTQGISAQAVHGTDREGLNAYSQGKIRFLCACELLNEGWDAPQTSILVMARPTMSKVLYTQQLGRGTRNYPGKEALYVVDVVDSYGAALQPWNLHGLFNLSHYQPFGDLIQPDQGTLTTELTILDGLWEGERRIEPINIFNFEREFGDLLNEEQLARELFVSTSTVKSWLKKCEIQADKTLLFGKFILNYFRSQQVESIRRAKGIKERTEATRRDDFFEFLALRDYTFSYKIAFMLSFITQCNDQGEVALDKLAECYQAFYQQLLEKYGQAEKNNNPLNKIEKLDDLSYITRSLLQNPFEKFERKRFVYHCKDLNIVSFDPVLWDKLTSECLNKVKQQYLEDGKNYFEKLGLKIDDKDFGVLLAIEDDVSVEDKWAVTSPY